MKYIAKILLKVIISFLLYSEWTIAQNPKWVWAISAGETEYDLSQSIVVDNKNAFVYITGCFSGTVDFDPGPDVTKLISNGRNDIFIAKYDTLGNLLWAKSFGGLENDIGNSIGIDAERNGEIYILGNYNNTVDFDPGPNVFQLVAFGREDMFILKLDSSGNFLWAKTFGVTGTIKPSFICIEPSTGCVYTTGYFKDTVDIDPGPGTYYLKAAGESDIFICKLNASGNLEWGKSYGGQNCYGNGNSIAFDPSGNGDLYLAGRYKESVDFNPGNETFFIPSAGDFDIFITKLDKFGNFIWAQGIGGAYHDIANSMTIDLTTGDIYITGEFYGILDFDPSLKIKNLISDAYRNTFILKLNSNGNYIWAKAIRGRGHNRGNSIILNNKTKDIYITGDFSDTIDFDPGSKSFNLASEGNHIYISSFDSLGHFRWVKSVEASKSQWATSSTLDANGNLYITGVFYDLNILFDTIILENSANQNRASRTPTLPKFLIAKLDISKPLVNNSSNKVHIYPLETTKYLNIEINEDTNEQINLKLINASGEIVYKDTINNNLRKKVIDTVNLNKGIYTVVIESNQIQIRKKIIKI